MVSHSQLFASIALTFDVANSLCRLFTSSLWKMPLPGFRYESPRCSSGVKIALQRDSWNVPASELCCWHFDSLIVRR